MRWVLIFTKPKKYLYPCLLLGIINFILDYVNYQFCFACYNTMYDYLRYPKYYVASSKPSLVKCCWTNIIIYIISVCRVFSQLVLNIYWLLDDTFQDGGSFAVRELPQVVVNDSFHFEGILFKFSLMKQDEMKYSLISTNIHDLLD